MIHPSPISFLPSLDNKIIGLSLSSLQANEADGGTMEMARDDGCDIGLSLWLGYDGRRLPASDVKQKQDPCTKSDPLHPNSATGIETSLTLGLSDEARLSKSIDVTNKAAGEEPAVGRWSSSPQSAVSSFSNPYTVSIKREKDMGSEDVEVERVSSRISDEEEDGNARKKLRLTKEQSALLEDRFKEHSTLNPKQKQALAKQLKLRPRQVEVWFQNRRARTKLKQTEVDCEFLKNCCETLTDENRRLQKELQELKALKFSPQLYMQLPAATLTMCPSCERIGGGGATDGSKPSAGVGAGPFIVAQKPRFFNPFTHSSSAAC